MRTRLARLLLAAARRLDPTLDTRPRRIEEVTPERIREVQDAINRMLAPKVEVRWRDPVPRSEVPSLAEQARVDHYIRSLQP